MDEPEQEHVCDACSSGNPNYNLAERMRELVDEHGYGVIGVYPDPGDPSTFWFSYTVGLTALGLPELAVTGMPSHASHTLLAALYQIISADIDSWRYFFADGGGQRFVPASAFLQDLEFDFAEVNPMGMPPLGGSVALYGPDIRAFQVMFPDENGRLPSALEYDAAKFPQPILERRNGLG